MNDLMKDILEGRLHPRAPKERMPPEHLAAMRAFRQLHGRWPLRSELETSQSPPKPLEASTDATPPAPLPLPTPEGEIASESDTRASSPIRSEEGGLSPIQTDEGAQRATGGSRSIEEIDKFYQREYKQGITDRAWMRQLFRKCPELIAKFNEVDRSEQIQELSKTGLSIDNILEWKRKAEQWDYEQEINRR